METKSWARIQNGWLLNRTARLVWIVLIANACFFYWVTSVGASGSLSVTPITWGVVGLDSNNVNVGPDTFPVGARICNSNSSTSSATVTFNWVDSTNSTYIYSTLGTSTSIALSIPGNGGCKDAYFQITVKRDSNSYDKTRRFFISAADGTGTASFPSYSREIYVEHLISQNRNATNDVKLNGTSIPIGGVMSLLVGNTYTITLLGSTATQGYEQLENFINLPNTIFQVNSVSSWFSANAGTDPMVATSKLYANGCGWIDNPASPNYRSCTGTGKYGGTIAVTYTVTIVGGAGSSTNLSSLIYDFSGSSYHYNADYSASTRIAAVIDPTNMTVSKQFVPTTILTNAVSTLRLTIPNTTTIAIYGVNITDPLPSNLKVASPTNASTTGCGASPTFSPNINDTTLVFYNGTIAPNSSCVIQVDVTSASTGTFNNTTGNLYINGATSGIGTGTGTNTNHIASATLNITSALTPPCTGGQTLAYWVVPTTTTAPPDNNGGGAASFKASNVATATASSNLTESIDNTHGVTDTYSWNGYPFVTKNATYFQFLVDTRHYSNVSMQFYIRNPGGGNGATSLFTGYWDGASFTSVLTDTNVNTYSAFTQVTAYFTGTTSFSGATTFRVTGSGSANNQNGNLMIDNIKFVGCTNSLYPPPTLTKSFSTSPILVNSTSILTFTLANTQTGNENLTNVRITDTLPSGLVIASPVVTSTTCTNKSFSATAGGTSISYNAGAMTAGATCSVGIKVQATRAGTFDNVSDFISASESGANQTSTGYGTASLTALAPPVISDLYLTSPISVGTTSVLSYTVTNPNPSGTPSLTGISFTDVLTNTAGLSVASSSSTCGGTFSASGQNVSLSNVTLAAGASCYISVVVNGNTPALYTHTTSNISSTNGGTGNTATATLLVNALNPGLTIRKQIGPTATGPWSKFLVVTPGSTNVYFNFTIENTGLVPLTNIVVNDPGRTLLNCPTTLAVYASGTCDVFGPVLAGSGWVTNTASVVSTEYYTTTFSSASYNSSDPTPPTAVLLSQFNANPSSVIDQFILPSVGIVVLSISLMLIRKRKRA